MKSQLQEIRKAKGYKSAKAFAEHIGMSVRTYTNYEQGITALTLEKAWEFADALDCSLDELAGRKRPRKAFSDPEQEALNGYYECMNETGRSALVESARLMSGSTEVRMEKNVERHVPLHSAMEA